MMLNLSRAEYRSQRDNRIEPTAACMPTARAMYYYGNNIEFHNPIGGADDDWLMMNITGHSAETFMIMNYPWTEKDGKILYPPNQVHGMYNKWLDYRAIGRRTSDFHTDLTVDDYITAMEDGLVIMTSCSFPEYGIDGHAICFIGWDGDLFHIADPWGNWRTEYKNHDGYDCLMSPGEFLDRIKPVGSEQKWGHLPLSWRCA